MVISAEQTALACLIEAGLGFALALKESQGILIEEWRHHYLAPVFLGENKWYACAVGFAVLGHYGEFGAAAAFARETWRASNTRDFNQAAAALLGINPRLLGSVHESYMGRDDLRSPELVKELKTVVFELLPSEIELPMPLLQSCEPDPE